MRPIIIIIIILLLLRGRVLYAPWTTRNAASMHTDICTYTILYHWLNMNV